MRALPSAGFTMLEVLVAMLVLAVGLLGGGAMQLAALRARHESLLLSGAVQLASGMAERMRANAGELDGVYLTLDYDAHAQPAPPPPARLCWDGGCDRAQLAQADLHDARQHVHGALPGGRIRICRDAAVWHGDGLRWQCSGGAGAPVVVKIGWRGKRPDGQADAPAREFAPSVALALAGAAP